MLRRGFGIGGPEAGYIRGIDYRPRVDEDPHLDAKAEKTVMEFFNKAFPETWARYATKDEDAGNRGPGFRGKATDVVVYGSGDDKTTPIMAVQVTTAESHDVRVKKMAEMQQFPFVRLPKINGQYVATPKVLIFLGRNELKTMQPGSDFDAHPKISLKILEATKNSLLFDLGKTKYEPEQEKVKRLLAAIETQIEILKSGGKMKIH